MGIMAGPDLQAFLHATTSIKGFFHAGWRICSTYSISLPTGKVCNW
jgi:hypothetical protein